jgi:Uma2 family endonuclease
LGGRRYIGSPKVPTVSVYVLVDGVYQMQQFRDGDEIVSSIFSELRLTAAEILTVVE